MRVRITRESGYVKRQFEIAICEEIEEYVIVTCPCCGGSGWAEGHYYDTNGRQIYIEGAECGLCRGSGEHEIYICHEVDEEIVIEEETYIESYQEGCVTGDEVYYTSNELDEAVERYKRLNGVVDEV